MSVLQILAVSVLFFSKFCEAKNCTCVPFYQCGDDYTIISDGRRLIDGRRLSEDCDGFLDLCCTYVSSSTPMPSKRPTVGCGHQSPDTFPWSAALFYKQYPNFVPSYKCRISLIHEQVAVTAAHCLQVRGYYQVRVNGTTRTVKYVHKHPSFEPETLQNDVALLILNKPIAEENIGTVCIPPPGMVLDGINCTTVTRGSNKGEYLKIISTPVVSSTECVKKLRETVLGRFFHLHQSFLCAGGGDYSDTCDGDGGSALICPIPGVPGRYQQGGIVSWGVECGGDFPGVYVNLAYFREWIDDVMDNSGFGIVSYRI